MKKLKSFDSYNEGKTFKANKKGRSGGEYEDKILLIKTKIEEHLKSIDKIEVTTVGSDFVIKFNGEKVGEVMFRDNYIGLRKEGQKFIDELGYNELGKIKFKINAIVKNFIN